MFDQLTANVYEPGEGICAHVDLHKFEDGIAIVSLGSAAVMDFTFGSCHERLLLRPGDVLLLEGDARWGPEEAQILSWALLFGDKVHGLFCICQN